MKGKRLVWVAVAVVAMLLVGVVAWVKEPGAGGAVGGIYSEEWPWHGKLKDGTVDGTVIDRSGLAEILRLHKLWLPWMEKEGQQAVLIGANLNWAGLSGADLRGANLSGASLQFANLHNINFNTTSYTTFRLTDIERHLYRTDLNGADLTGAILTDAILIGADLRGANLSLADLAGAIFEPNTTSTETTQTSGSWMPGIKEFARAKNIWQLTYLDNPQPLASIRDKLRQYGYLQQSHQLSHALRHNRGSVGWTCYIAYYLFAWPTDWGLDSLRPIGFMLLLLVFPFGLFYFLFAFPGLPSDGKNTIWQVWPEDALCSDPDKDQTGPLRLSGLGMLKFGFYFSLLSAFHIGWRDLNVGSWIARMQPREYTLRATGWVRFVSGLQSLISVYLLALAVLTYFGRPFE